MSVDHRTWQKTLYAGLILPWRKRLSAREQEEHHLMLADWLEEHYHFEEAAALRSKKWIMWWDKHGWVYAIDAIPPSPGPIAPHWLHWWPRDPTDRFEEDSPDDGFLLG